MLAGLLVFAFEVQIKKSIKLLLAFSGAYLLAVCFLHLVPDIYSGSSVINVGLFILIGFLLQLFLEFASQGIEHGHVHVHGNHFPTGIFISLCLHALIEGMPLDAAEHAEHIHAHAHGNHSLLYGIVLHKIPVAIVLTIMFIKIGLSKFRTLGLLLVFALMAPIGALLNHQFGDQIAASFPEYYSMILGVVVGMILHISTTILFEASEGHKFNLLKLVSIVVGGMIAFLTL